MRLLPHLAQAVLAAFAVLGAGCEEPEPERLLVVGWDGASFRQIDRLVAEGKLPNVERLLQRGAHARLESTVIPISSAAWTSATTGKGPGHTGVYSFFAEKEGGYDVELISSRSLRAAPVWRILTARGKRSLVVGCPITYPPEPIAGVMVAGMLSPFQATYTHPPELTSELRARGFEPDLDVWTEARPVGWDDYAEQLLLKEELLLELLDEERWDLAFLVFKSLDVGSHRALGEDFGTFIEPLYLRLDAILGSLLDAVGPNTNVLLMSDHGFYAYPYGLNLHAWLLQQGFSVQKDKVKRFGIRENDPHDERERAMVMQLRNELDWSRTRAFADKCEGNFGGIRLNRAGREHEGIVTDADAEAVLAEMERALLALEDHEGRRLVTRVFRGRELYPGPYTDVVPDLLFETVEDCQVFADPEEPQLLGPYGELVPDHDRIGVLVAAGPSIAKRSERGDARLVDVAPTILHLLEQPVYDEMEGRVLTELLTLERPVVSLPEADDPLLRATEHDLGSPFTEDELRELNERLGGLGYSN